MGLKNLIIKVKISLYQMREFKSKKLLKMQKRDNKKDRTLPPSTLAS